MIRLRIVVVTCGGMVRFHESMYEAIPNILLEVCSLLDYRYTLVARARAVKAEVVR